MTDRVYIGCGSNLGDRLENLATALRALEALDETHVVAVSRVVESEPWGVTDQPPFANAVAEVTTAIRADRFLEALKDIEFSMGRRPGARNAARVIDLDILLFGDEEWASANLVVPHPRMAERDFVVTPLFEIAPHARWPSGEPVTAERATEGRVTGVLGVVPGFGDRTVFPHEGVSPAAEGWEAVVVVHVGMSGELETATSLLFDAALLARAGISVGWDPVPPGREVDIWPVPRTYRLLVPSSDAARARSVLADAHAVNAVFSPSAEDGYLPGPDGEGASVV